VTFEFRQTNSGGAMMSDRSQVHIRLRAFGTAVVLAALPALAASPARAAVGYDVSVGLPIGDDAKVFLNVTNEYYAPPQQVAMAVVRRCPDPEDDYPAIFFLAHASRRSPAAILDLRLQGESWADIMFSIGVRPSVLFVGIDGDPGPPYGRAWGYWRQHPRERLKIRDRDFVEYAKLQVASGYYRVRPRTIIAERQRGVTVERYVVNRRHGQGRGSQGERGRGEGNRGRGEGDRARGQEDGDKEHGGKGHGPKDHGPKEHKPHGH
jgi:hypothetical protein